jgi:hypothetical protein
MLCTTKGMLFCKSAEIINIIPATKKEKYKKEEKAKL